MLLYAVATLVAVMPSVLVLLILLRLRCAASPSARRILGVFLLAGAATPLAWLTVWVCEVGWMWLPPTLSLALGTAFGEEGLKLALLIWLALLALRHSEPYAAVLLGAAVGFGYGSAESLMYVATVDRGQVLTEPLARMVTTVPFHGALGIISATLLARTVYVSGMLWLRRFALTYLLPVLLHASYIVLAVIAEERRFTDPRIAWPCIIIVCGEILAVTVVAVVLATRSRPRAGAQPPLRPLTSAALPSNHPSEQRPVTEPT